MGRCAFFLSLWVLASGCARWTGVAQARQAVWREGLTEQRLPDGFRPGLARTSAGLDCRIGGDFVERCKAGVQNVWFEVRDGAEGGEIIVPPIASEQQITTFWRGVDLENYRAFEKELPARMTEHLRLADASFVPTWGLMAAVTTSVSAQAPVQAFGTKLGLRRWWSINLGWHLAADYGFRLTTVSHHFGLRAGIELTRFTPGRLFGAVGAPPWSVSAFVGPRLQIPGPIPGVRTGLGLQLTDWKMAPVLVEFSADTWFRGEQSTVDFNFTIGIGI